jgi:hypothetical protein
MSQVVRNEFGRRHIIAGPFANAEAAWEWLRENGIASDYGYTVEAL